MVKETNHGHAGSKYKLTSSGIAAICSSNFFGAEFSPSERRAGARAMLRHHKHVDNKHIVVREAGGLHPMYVALHGQGEGNQQEQNEIKTILSESLGDVFDSVTTQDRIDGGITLLLRCPGWRAATNLTIDNVCIDVYITPRELAEGGLTMTENVARMVQAFGEDIALPHLHRFTNRCLAEGIKAPELPSFAKQLQVGPPAYLPLLQKGSARIRCRCEPKRVPAHQEVEKMGEYDDDFWLEAAELAAQYDEPSLVKTPSPVIELEGPPHTLLTVRNASRAAVSTRSYSASTGIMCSIPNKADDGFEGAIIAFGPETDSILD